LAGTDGVLVCINQIHRVTMHTFGGVVLLESCTHSTCRSPPSPAYRVWQSWHQSLQHSCNWRNLATLHKFNPDMYACSYFGLMTMMGGVTNTAVQCFRNLNGSLLACMLAREAVNEAGKITLLPSMLLATLDHLPHSSMLPRHSSGSIQRSQAT
jgi:hypothetical protein